MLWRRVDVRGLTTILIARRLTTAVGTKMECTERVSAQRLSSGQSATRFDLDRDAADTAGMAAAL